MKEALEILRYITPGKAINLFRIWLGFHISRLTGKPVMIGRPVAISIEPTTSCNLRCPECPSGLRSFSRPTGMLDLDSFRVMIDKVKKDLIYLNLYFQGEPYLNPDFQAMVRYARGNRIYTATSTNAHFLDDRRARETVESGLDRIVISMDGADQATYSTYRVGGQLDRVKTGIQRLVHWKNRLGRKQPHIILQVLIFRFNMHQMNELHSLGRELGVDEVKFKTAQVYNFERGSELIPDNGSLSRYRRGDKGTYLINSSMENHCWRMWSSAVVTWDGHMVPCCFDKDARYPMGNILEEGLDDLWLGSRYRIFRKDLFRNRKKIDICANCSEGSKVWI